MPILDGYESVLTGGVHPETATLAHALDYVGVRNPTTGSPYSEAMLLGLGGGLGAGYILWEFGGGQVRAIVLGFRNNWQYGVRFLSTVAERVGVEPPVYETGGARLAERHLLDALDAGRPALAWVDEQLLGRRFLPSALEGSIGQIVGVYGVDEDGRVLVDDRATATTTVDGERFARARARISSFKHRLLVPAAGSAPSEAELAGHVRAAIADCAANLLGTSSSFSLQAFRKWGRLMADVKAKKGWLRVFADGRGLVGTLVSTYEALQVPGRAGGPLRGLYADFLDEASQLLQAPELSAIAKEHRDLEDAWRELAAAVLPEDVPGLARLARLADAIDDAVRRGDAGAADAADAAAEMRRVREQLGVSFSSDRAEVERVLASLSGRVLAIEARERAAAERLAGAAR